MKSNYVTIRTHECLGPQVPQVPHASHIPTHSFSVMERKRNTYTDYCKILVCFNSERQG
jgi:hypothetical protein